LFAVSAKSVPDHSLASTICYNYQNVLNFLWKRRKFDTK